MELKLITTVGTSIFTNYQQTYLNEEKSIDNALDKLKNLRAKQLDWKNPYVINLIGDDEDWGIQEKFFKGYVIKDEEKWKEINDLNIYASAEIFSIIKLYEKYKQNNEYIKIKVHLLASDTVLSILAAKLIKEWFELNNEEYKSIEIIFNDNVNSPNADYIENLRTDLDEENIFDGFNNLISKILELSKNNKENTIINITGGYKGFIPILTIVAQLENLKLNYIYEDSDKLIEIGKFPINFDWAIAEIYHYFITNKEVRNRIDENTSIFKFLVNNFILDRQKRLTQLGKIFEKYINKFLPERQDVLGYYMEHKLFEYFFEVPLEGKYKIYKLGEDFWWHRDNRSIFFTEDDENIRNIAERVEIDIQLKDEFDNYVFIESKAFSGIKKAIEQIKKYIEFNERALKKELKAVGIFVYKFDFQNITKNRFETLKEYCNNKSIDLYIFTYDIPIKIEKGTINYKKIFTDKLKDKMKIIKLT